MKISTKSQYGLRAMVYLAKFKGSYCPLRIISKNEDISFDYLEKIISKLEKASLVKAKKGVQGGYFLAKSPSKIKLGEIIRVLEGEASLVKCLPRIIPKGFVRGIAKKEKYHCPREKKCLTKNFWKKIQDSLNSVLDSLTLADLINPKGVAIGRPYGARK